MAMAKQETGKVPQMRERGRGKGKGKGKERDKAGRAEV
jgi:hypothetical protein